MKINEIIILIIFSIIISSCSVIPKPNPDKPDSILIVPVSVTNKSKHPITQQFQFTFSNKDDGSEVFHAYLPKVDNSYLIIKNLKPGNYQFLRVHNTKNSKVKKEPSNSTFKMEDDTITIIQDQFVYKQTVRGGNWYTYNFNTSYLNKGGYNKLIEKLEGNENFKSWKIRCKWCNNDIKNVYIKHSKNCDNLGKSEGGGRKVRLRFNNQTNSSIEAFWVDFDGKPKSYGTYSSGEIRGMDTFEKHPWFFINADTKKCVGTYIPHFSDHTKQVNIME